MCGIWWNRHIYLYFIEKSFYCFWNCIYERNFRKVSLGYLWRVSLYLLNMVIIQEPSLTKQPVGEPFCTWPWVRQGIFSLWHWSQGLIWMTGLPFLLHYTIQGALSLRAEGSHQKSSQILEHHALIKVIRLNEIWLSFLLVCAKMYAHIKPSIQSTWKMSI